MTRSKQMYTKNQIRIRNNADIRPLNISQEGLKTINRIMLKPGVSRNGRNYMVRKLGVSPCCVCSGVPSVELSYKVGTKYSVRVRVVEYYCDSCLKIVFEREKEEPSKEAIPSYYNCIKVDQIPHA